jgi:hypothetical protein
VGVAPICGRKQNTGKPKLKWTNFGLGMGHNGPNLFGRRKIKEYTAEKFSPDR